MWKSNGCTLTPTVAARARRRRRKKTRQSSVVSPVANPPRERTAPRPNPVARAHAQNKKQKKTQPPSIPSPNQPSTLVVARVASSTYANTSSQTPQSSDASRRLSSLRPSRRARLRQSLSRASLLSPPSIIIISHARAHIARASVDIHPSNHPSRGFPLAAERSNAVCPHPSRLVASSRTRPAITDEDELKRRDLSLRRRGHGRSVKEARIARARLCRSRDERDARRASRAGMDVLVSMTYTVVGVYT